jgi:TPR repeat protein
MRHCTFISSFAVLTVLCLPHPTGAQALIEQMSLSDLQKCGALSLDMWTSTRDLAEYDKTLKAVGGDIRAESDALDVARHKLQIRDVAQVKRFNAGVNALNARVSAYRIQVGQRNAKVQKANDTSLQFNVLCAHRPYSPEMAAALPPAQAEALARGATSVEIPVIDNAPDPTAVPADRQGAVVLGGRTRAPPAEDAASASASPGLETADDVRKAAEHGDAEAQYRLGESYVTGGPFGRDDASGLSWLSKAAEQGNAKALFSLSVMYDEGRGAPVDETRARAYLVKAAGLGYAAAEHNLAVWCAERDHGPRARSEAAAWMEKAAAQGDPESQFLLSDYLAKGYGGDVSAEQVTTWLRRSAMQGYRPAQLEMGRRFEKADGFARDPVEALKWDLLAAGGVSDADRLDASRGCIRTALEDVHTREVATSAVARLQNILSPEQSDRAARLAESWRTGSGAKPATGC